MALRSDADLVPVGPVHEISAPGVERVLRDRVIVPPASGGLGVPAVGGGRREATFVTDFLPDDGNVILSVPFDPSRYDDVWISIEPAGSEPSVPSDDRWQASGSDAAA